MLKQQLHCLQFLFSPHPLVGYFLDVSFDKERKLLKVDIGLTCRHRTSPYVYWVRNRQHCTACRCLEDVLDSFFLFLPMTQKYMGWTIHYNYYTAIGCCTTMIISPTLQNFHKLNEFIVLVLLYLFSFKTDFYISGTYG